jgi:hypothetical protein
MKYLYILLIMAFLPFQSNAQDESTSEEKRSTFGVTLTMENAFGFYPVIYGSIEISPTLDFIYYGAMWTNPSFGLPQTTYSSDLWLENGFGIGFDAFGGNAYVNPSIGFAHGKFLSGSDESVAFEGIIPSLSLYLYPGIMDMEVYFSYYTHLRDEVPDPNPNFRSTAGVIFYWMTPGVYVSKTVILGMHYEGLYLKFGEGDFESSYQWFGPSIKFRTKQKYDFRFAAGPNLKDGIYSKEFYKLSVNIPFD